MAIRPLLVVLAVAGSALAQPTVPGFDVTVYANVTDPGSLSFASDSAHYVGRDASGSGGGSGDAVKIHRIGPGGTPVAEFGAAAIFDPDGVLVDETGTMSGTPGAVLVCGVEPSGTGQRAGRLEPLGWLWTTPGFTDERIWLYLATDLAPSRQDLQPDEVLAVGRVPFEDAVTIAERGDLVDAKSALALLRAAAFLRPRWPRAC